MEKKPNGSSQPLRHAYRPIEHLTSTGDIVFRTSDGKTYRRLADGSIRRLKRTKNANA